MDSITQNRIVTAFNALPGDCRCVTATETQLEAFERKFGAIPPEYRWFLRTCGGGVCGSEWLDGIEELPNSHRKFEREFGTRGWTMQKVFVIGWDGSGNPIGVHRTSGKVLIEDHTFGGIHEVAQSVSAFLAKGYDATD